MRRSLAAQGQRSHAGRQQVVGGPTRVRAAGAGTKATTTSTALPAAGNAASSVVADEQAEPASTTFSDLPPEVLAQVLCRCSLAGKEPPHAISKACDAAMAATPKHTAQWLVRGVCGVWWQPGPRPEAAGALPAGRQGGCGAAPAGRSPAAGCRAGGAHQFHYAVEIRRR
mmetsp:Transcript_21133/g.53719  ORF Transcript_21133/g.53719 Transcript_21133/m.53719 type:complete len:170 (+) Transcript_21133:251-760(+)